MLNDDQFVCILIFAVCNPGTRHKMYGLINFKFIFELVYLMPVKFCLSYKPKPELTLFI